MPFNGSGDYSPPAADFPGVTLTVISSSKYNSVINDIAGALDNCVTRDGQSPATNNLPMGGFHHTGVSDGAALNQYPSVKQVQNQSFTWCGTAGGTADALTLSPTPTITAYAAGQVFAFKAGASPNTGAATLAVSGLAAKALQSDGVALSAGWIAAGKWYDAEYDGTAFQLTRKALPQFIDGIAHAWTAANSFIDNLFSLLDNSDNTKVIQFDASSMPTGTTRTVNPGPVVNTISATSYTLLASDFGKLLIFTAASDVTLTLPQIASAGFGLNFYFDFIAPTAASVILTRSSSDIILGPDLLAAGATAASVPWNNSGVGVVNASGARVVAGAAASWYLTNVERVKVIERFESTGAFSWTCPAWVRTAYQTGCAGGGGGGASNAGANGGGGGGGGESVYRRARAVTPGTGYSGSVGTAGAAGVSGGAAATAGGNTTFDTLTLNGGGLGANSGAGGAGGTGGGGIAGGAGGAGTAGGGTVTGASGGGSFFGTGGPSGVGVGAAGGGYGGGGAGDSNTPGNGGAGKQGFFLIEG